MRARGGTPTAPKLLAAVLPSLLSSLGEEQARRQGMGPIRLFQQAEFAVIELIFGVEPGRRMMRSLGDFHNF